MRAAERRARRPSTPGATPAASATATGSRTSPTRAPLTRLQAWQVFRPARRRRHARGARAASLGRHDFGAFRAADCAATTPCASCAGSRCWASRAGRIEVVAEATAFLKHMVRNLVGTLVEVGLGRARARQRCRGARQRRDRTLRRPHRAAAGALPGGGLLLNGGGRAPPGTRSTLESIRGPAPAGQPPGPGLGVCYASRPFSEARSHEPEEAEGRRPRRDRHGRPAVRRVARESPLVRGDARRRERQLGGPEVRGRREGALGARGPRSRPRPPPSP